MQVKTIKLKIFKMKLYKRVRWYWDADLITWTGKIFHIHEGGKETSYPTREDAEQDAIRFIASIGTAEINKIIEEEK